MGKRPPPRPVLEGEGPWLIWSNYWGRWHRRSEDGSACGYTDDIDRAGVFDFAAAKDYHGSGDGSRDEAIPVSRHLAEMEAKLVALTARRDALSDRIAQVKLWLEGSARV